MKWYKHDPDAFLAGTVELTHEECGVYIRLIDHCYSRDGEIWDDDAFVARLLNSQPRLWRRMKTILMAKGKIWVKDGKIKIKRVEKTISEAEEFSNIQKMRAKKRWESTKEPCQDGNAITTTTTSTEERKKTYGRSPSAPDPASDQAFEEFWKAYPKREGANPKLPARKAFLRALRDTEASVLLEAVRGHSAASAGLEPRFIPRAATWLNERRWEDETAPADGLTIEQREFRRRLADEAEQIRKQKESGHDNGPDHQQKLFSASGAVH